MVFDTQSHRLREFVFVTLVKRLVAIRNSTQCYKTFDLCQVAWSHTEKGDMKLTQTVERQYKN